MRSRSKAARRAVHRFVAVLVALAFAATGLGVSTSPAVAAAELTAQQKGFSVHLAWPAMPEATSGYAIGYAQEAAPADLNGATYSAVFDAGATSGTLSPPFPAGDWYFTVFALRDGDLPLAGDSAGPVGILQATPTVTVDEDSVTSSTADVDWTEVDGASGYAVGAFAATGEYVVPTPATVGMSEVDGLTTTLTGLQPGTPYNVFVVPLTADGGWGSEGSDSLTTVQPPVTGVTVAQRGEFLHVSWVEPDGGAAGGYYVSLGDGAGPTPEFDDFSDTAESGESSVDVYYDGAPGLVKVAVYAQGAGFSGHSAPAVATGTWRDPMAEPTVTTTGATASSISISWTTVPGASGYKVAALTDAAFEGDEPITPQLAGFSSATGTSHTFTGLDPDTDYYPYVFPVFENGGWGSSGSDYAATLPLPVGSLTAVPNSTGTGATQLSWTYEGTPEGFIIVAQQGSAPTDPDCDEPCQYISYVDGTERGYSVSEGQLGGSSAMSQLWHFSVFAQSFSSGEVSEAATATATPWSTAALKPLSYYADPYYVPAAGSVPASYGLNVRWEPPFAAWSKVTVTMAAGTTAPVSDATGVIFTCTKAGATTCAATSFLKKPLNANTKYSFAVWFYDAAGNKSSATFTELTRVPGVYINGAWVRGSGLPFPYGHMSNVFDASNNQHVVYAKTDGLYYGRRLNGSTTWSWSKVPGSIAGDFYAMLRVRSNGTLVLALERFGSTTATRGIFYQTKLPTGAWTSPARIAATDSTYSLEDIELDSANTSHVVLSRYTMSTSTSGLFYTRRTATGSAFLTPLKIANTTRQDYAELVRDTAKTKLAVVITRYGLSSQSTYVSIKPSTTSNFPTPVLRAGVGAGDYPIGMTIHGTRAQLYFNRHVGENSTGNGVFMQTALVGGTATAPSLSWRAGAPFRVGGTTYKDSAHDVVLAPNGKVGMTIHKNTMVASERGIFLAESSTAGLWSVAPVRKSPAAMAMYDYISALAYTTASGQSFAFLRH